ncbi:MAG: PhzF family phenazine biosynthesis protein [Burkholderiales bacterium]|nr:PhzF family phenazine biosynthesis protein [Burkholderiales bacterium]
MELSQFTIDAFADQVFKGNPASVCFLQKWLPDTLLQNIAQENNQSETAFVVEIDHQYHLRWFSPAGEIDICGHGTLAAAYALFRFVEQHRQSIRFQTKSGPLVVVRVEDMIAIDLPSFALTQVPVTDEMEKAIGFRPVEAWLGRDLVCVMEDTPEVMQANPEPDKVKSLDGELLHVTAKGTKYDCVTRSFGPEPGLVEDPVCGSGHCHVIPLWSKKLNKSDLVALQASKRTGILSCRTKGDRVYIAGKASLYAESRLFIPDELTKTK